VADVFLMAILASFISAILPPTVLMQWLTMISAAGLAILGLFSLIRAIKRYRDVQKNPSLARVDDDAHARAHAMGVAHRHEGPQVIRLSGDQVVPMMIAASDHHPDPMRLVRSHDHQHDTFRQSLWMGFLGSLAPCPTAWAMFMATLSIGRLGAGVLLLIAFSIGLYTTVVLIGILLVISKQFALKRTPIQVTYALPIVSGVIITGLGIALLAPYLLR
jgi:nickel/cobalt exporter